MQFWFGVAAGLLIGWIGEWLLTRRSVIADRRKQTPSFTVSYTRHVRNLSVSSPGRDSGSDRSDGHHRGCASGHPVEDQAADVADDLTVIKGIGPVFAERLNAAGIYSYTDLAQASPEALQAAVATNQKVASEVWIAQAKTLL